MLTSVIIFIVFGLAGGTAWAMKPTFDSYTAKKADEREKQAASERDKWDRQERVRMADEEKQREKWAREQAEKHERLARNPIDRLLAFSYRNLAQTESLNNEARAAGEGYEETKAEFEDFTKEFSDGKAPTTKDLISQTMAAVSWVVLAVVQAVLIGWVLYSLTHDLLITGFGTLGFVTFLEGPGIIISHLCGLRKKGLITETRQRLGIVVSCAVMVAVIATLAFMAGYRAYLVNEDELISAHASQIVAKEDGDSYLMSVADEKEAQANNRIQHERVFFGVLEAGICLAETILALFIPAYLMTWKYRRRKLALKSAERNRDVAQQRLKSYQVQKLTELAQHMEANDIDLTILEYFKTEGQLMLLPENIESVPRKDFSAFVYGSDKYKERTEQWQPA
jgi:hypothetical protein